MLPLGRAEKVCGNLLENTIPLWHWLGTVSTTQLGRAEKVCGNLLANIAVTIFRNSVHAAARRR
jgi:hypothetical protein